ncbi:CDP-diacylglycerol--serine O-phosphatidyltransferase, partial [bacterium]|nr:CDP-diacylglycerol--serine O-phosphatidyltransferase [bacterium]
LFFACGALRLARFNVQSDNEESHDFQGLPIPTAAYVLATLVIFYDDKFGISPERNYIILAATFLLSLLMVSTIKYRSFKQIDFKSKKSFFVLVGVVGAIFVIALNPKVTLLFLVSSYVVFGVIEELITLRKSREYLEKRRQRKAEKPDHKCLSVVGGEDISQDDEE